MASTARKTSPPDNLRNTPGGKTTWKNGVPSYGWYKMPDEWWDHLARLQRGLYQRMLIEFVWGAMIPRQDGVAMPEWSRAFTYIELAERLRCSPEQVRDDARNARDRGMVAVDESHGRVKFQVLWQKWGELQDYTPPKIEIVKKKEAPKIKNHWFSSRVTVRPGESYDFTVPELPEDFQLQKISFRNTGESESVTIAGGGPAEGGVIVLETEAENRSRKQKTSESVRDSTPVKASGSSPSKEGGKQEVKLGFTSPLAKTLSKFGILSDLSVRKLVEQCQSWAPECSLEEIESAVLVIGDNASQDPKARNVAGIILTSVPDCFKTGHYREPRIRKKDAMSERERLAWEIERTRKKASNE